MNEIKLTEADLDRVEREASLRLKGMSACEYLMTIHTVTFVQMQKNIVALVALARQGLESDKIMAEHDIIGDKWAWTVVNNMEKTKLIKELRAEIDLLKIKLKSPHCINASKISHP